MSVLDIFKTKEFKEKIDELKQLNNALNNSSEELQKNNEELKNNNEELKSQNDKLKIKNVSLIKENKIRMTMRQLKAIDLTNLIKDKEEQVSSLSNTLKSQEKSIEDSKKELYELEAQVGDLEAKNEMAGYGLPEPLYEFATSSEYKDELRNIREEQKDDIRYGTAYFCETNWTVNDSLAKGRAMIKRDVKALFRSFNNECTSAINKVTYSNYDRISVRIQKSFEQHNKMHKEYGLRINDDYLQLKLDELNLAYNYKVKKEEEKELLREQRAKEKEERRAQKEYLEEQKSLEKEMSHYKKAINELSLRVDTANETDKRDMEKEIQELKLKLSEYNDKKDDIDYRINNSSAGYVYIISNIGSFGKDIVKIGVTRRLDPIERINELSSASVPFRFDVHALIFSENAFELENKLHHRFDKCRVNKVNNRKEYFRIPIEQVEKELEKYKDVTVDFHEAPQADEYRETLAISNNA